MFTELQVKNLKPKDKEYYVTEGKGFSIRVRPNGAKTFYFRYTFEKKQKKLVLGEYPYVSLAQARESYHKAHSIARYGADPAVKVQEIVQSDSEALTVQDVCDAYLEWSSKHHVPAVTYIAKSTLFKHIIPVWGQREAATITRKDTIVMLSQIPTDGAAQNVYKHIRSAYQLAVDTECLTGSPFANLKRPLPRLVGSARKRILSPAEIKTVWHQLVHGPGTESTRQAIMMVLLTAQRPGEVAGMHSDEIEEDWDGDLWWTIPGGRTKNGNSHMVYLTPSVLELICNKKGYIFITTNGDKALCRHALSHLIAKENYYDLPRWTPHDLRRTARTNFTRMGVPLPVSEAILNHAKAGVVKIYDLHEYKEEKKKAMLLWEKELRKLLGDNFLSAVPRN